MSAIAQDFASTGRFIRETAFHLCGPGMHLVSSASGTNADGHWQFDLYCDPREPIAPPLPPWAVPRG